MKHKKIILFIGLMFFIGCAKKDVIYYRDKYIKDKENYREAERLLSELLGKNDSLFKMTIEFTGRRIVGYQYRNDSKIDDFLRFSDSYESFFSHFMYDQDLKYFIYYRDSVKFVYSGRNQDIIVHYLSGYKPIGGFLIDTNTYLFFEGTRSY